MRASYPLPVASGAAAVILLLAFLAGCERAPVEEESPAPTFSELQTEIFSQSCTQCHAGNGAPQGLDLSEGNAYDNLVNVQSSEVSDLDLVEPGNPDDSYLVIKLEGGARMAEGTAQMPLGAPSLSQDKIDLVRQWIEDGAPDN